MKKIIALLALLFFLNNDYATQNKAGLMVRKNVKHSPRELRRFALQVIQEEKNHQAQNNGRPSSFLEGRQITVANLLRSLTPEQRRDGGLLDEAIIWWSQQPSARKR